MKAPVPRALLAAEMGAGRGHVVKLAKMAQALGPQVQIIAALPALRFAPELRALGVRVLRCPQLKSTPEMRADNRLAGNATLACYLAAQGLVRPDVVRASLAFWRQLIVAENISILIGDFAPLALRAAQGLQAEGWEIRIIAVGTGYGVPPAGLEPLPHLHPAYGRVVHPEPLVLETLNSAGADMGLPPLPRLAALYDVDLALPATFPFLDAYAGWRDPATLCPPLVDLSRETASGAEVFVYFSRDEPDRPEVLQALERLPLPRRGYLPAIAPETRARLLASGMVLEEAPVPADLIAARSALILHAAPHGTLAMAALAGLPQLGLFGHKEQAVHAARAEAAGVLRAAPLASATADSILDALRSLHADPAARARAQDVARALRAGFPPDPMADLARRLAPEVAAARRFATA